MKLERLPEYLTTATAVLLGAGVSLYFGTLAGEGNVGVILAMIFGACFMAMLLRMRQAVWVLVPVCSAFTGALQEIPLQLSFTDVVNLAVLATTFMLIAVKAIRFKPRWSALDFWLWATLIYLVLTWVRHPTGGHVLNSDRVGGRAYLGVAIGLASYYVLSRAALPVSWKPKWFLTFAIGASVFQGFLFTISHFWPGFSLAVGRYYSGVELPDLSVPAAGTVIDPVASATERQGYMQAVALPVVRWLVARYRPLTLINPLFPWRTTFFVISMLACLMAGFRSSLLNTVGIFMVASHLRRGNMEVFRVAFLGFFVALLLVASSYFVRLPNPIQRALTVLPGQWDETVVADARYSQDWRYLMWKLMLSGDRYIENKWLGDGFGFSAAQLQQMASNEGTLQAQENLMIVGQVHSGPVSAIRFVGYIGLALYLILIIMTAREAYRLCRVTMGTPMEVLTWYFCLPIIWEPINYVFIFGSYDYAIPLQVYSVGLLKMLRNSIEARAAAEVEAPAPTRRRELIRVQRPALAGLPRRPALAQPRI